MQWIFSSYENLDGVIEKFVTFDGSGTKHFYENEESSDRKVIYRSEIDCAKKLSYQMGVFAVKIIHRNGDSVCRYAQAPPIDFAFAPQYIAIPDPLSEL